MNKIITVGREFGSGGRELGRRLAEALGFEYYDKEIVSEIAAHTSLSEEYIKQVLECTPHRLYPITVGHSMAPGEDYTFRQIQTIFEAQSEILKKMAETSNCVIVGRCADYILRDYKPFRLFVHASLESRAKRCRTREMPEEHLTDRKLYREIKRIDKGRARYYSFYTGQKWGDKENYDMCINTTDTTVKEIVPVLAKIFE